MPHSFRWIAFLTATAGSLFLATAIAAVAPEIRDEAKFFSPAALKKADERIREIYRKYQRDVLIETFATVPAADVEKVKAMDAEKRAAYFQQWAKDRSRDRVVNGVYVIVCKEPRHLFVGVNEQKPPRFPPDTWKEIEDVFRNEFRQTRFDEGLDRAVQLIEEKLAKK